LPFAAGAALLWATGHTRNESLFMGTALVATSVGITARVLADMGRIRESESRVILGAAVVDDVLGLIILAVVSGSVAGELSVDSIAWLALLAIAFVVLVGGLGSRLVQRAIPSLDRLGEAGVFVVAMGVCLSLAAVAGALELAAFIGAFLAGMAFAETRDRYRLEANVGIVYIFLVPFFFVITGTNVDLDVFTQGDTAALTVGVILVAVAGKLLGCGVAASRMGRRSALIVGTGMVPRGEVGILVASLGLSRGVIGLDLYGVVVAMSVGTTLLVPPVLVALFKGRPAGPPVPRRHTGEIEGIGG
jgi:Kef-type K+ transport system membrane component KefB